MTLQELREALKGKQTDLAKISKNVDERRAAGKIGAELWDDADKKAFDTLTGEIGTLSESIEAEERAESLKDHLARANEQRSQQTRNGRLDPRLNDTLPGSDVNYGDRFNDRDQARNFARTEEKRCLVLHAWACEQRASEYVTDKHRQAIVDLKVNNLGGSLEFRGHGNQAIQSVRSILNQSGDFESRRLAAQNHLTALEGRSIGYDTNYQSWVPVAFRDAFEIAFHGMGGVMSICDLMITDSADQLPWPFADDYANEGEQVDEVTPTLLNAAGADAEMLIPKLGAYDFTSKYARIAKALLANSPFDLATMLGTVLGERINRAMERKLTLGDRSSTFGGFLARGVSGTTTPIATPVSIAKLQALIWSVISNHRDNGTLVMHDATLAMFAALLDTNGQPLLNIGNGRLQYAKDVSVPYKITNYMKPGNGSGGALAAGDKLIAFGNFKQMKVRVVRQVRLERLNEKFAEYHQAAFLANRSGDADLLRSTQTANCPIKYQALT